MSGDRMTRRDFFLHRTAGQPRIVEICCERLFMKYVDARSAGSLPQFLRMLERELDAADEVQLTSREWLASDDFRADVESLLTPALSARARHRSPA